MALQYRISDSNGLYQLKNWKDIITSVDIFVTPPLTRDKTGELIKAIGPERSREYTDKGDFFIRIILILFRDYGVNVLGTAIRRRKIQ